MHANIKYLKRQKQSNRTILIVILEANRILNKFSARKATFVFIDESQDKMAKILIIVPKMDEGIWEKCKWLFTLSAHMATLISWHVISLW